MRKRTPSTSIVRRDGLFFTDKLKSDAKIIKKIRREFYACPVKVCNISISDLHHVSLVELSVMLIEQQIDGSYSRPPENSQNFALIFFCCKNKYYYCNCSVEDKAQRLTLRSVEFLRIKSAFFFQNNCLLLQVSEVFVAVLLCLDSSDCGFMVRSKAAYYSVVPTTTKKGTRVIASWLHTSFIFKALKQSVSRFVTQLTHVAIKY